MENTKHLSDQDILSIAWEAVREHFENADITDTTISIEERTALRHSLFDEADEPATVVIWLNHLGPARVVNPEATTKANGRIWLNATNRGDVRYFSLFHSFPEDVQSKNRAA
jgi:hypothetical protein